VVQRQRGDDDFFAELDVRTHPRRGLLHVCHEIAVREHRPLRHAGGAAGVLQEGDVVMGNLHGGQRLELSDHQCITEAHGALDFVVRHHLLHVAQHEIDDRALRETDHVA
jgi:hypothetical protein